jgi:phytoene dehydrogenase-like protein
MEPGGRMRRIYEGLGLGGDLSFLELNPDGFDHVILQKEGIRFDIPRGKQRLADRLSSRFPHEREGIQRYLDTVEKLAKELDGMMHIAGVGDVLKLPFRARNVLRWGLRSAGALINAHVKDPVVRGILAAQCGDHGLPPSLVSAPLHAAVIAHYFDGGFYPKGGAYTIPRAFIRALRRAGSEIRVRAEVSKILVEAGRAIGVRLADGTEIRARHVISNADPEITFNRLVGPEHLSRGLRRKLDRTKWSISALSLFLAVDMDVRAAGMDSGNYWSYPDCDVEGVYRRGMTAWGAGTQELPGTFLTCTTLKDPGKLRAGHHTMESFTFVGYDAYRAWEQSKLGERPAAYNALKSEMTDKMLAAADKVIPGLRERVVFAELGTPLTNVHYCAATAGNLYGTEKSIWQVGPWSWPLRTEIKDLTLCGSSTLGHGVLGATISGLVAARAGLGGSISDLLRQGGPSIRILQSEDPKLWAAPSRRMLPREEHVSP